MNFAPHDFSLRQLQYACAVAELSSFRRAAELCHVSQPSLSAQLAQMETALGVRLFERDRRRVLMTEAGREVIARARHVLSGADDLVEVARQAGDPLGGQLRVGVIPTLSPYLLPSIAPALSSAYPRLRLRWVEDKTDVLVRDLAAGNLDAALLALEAEIGDLEQEVVATDAFVLATSLDDPLGAKTAPVEPNELSGTGVLLLDDGHCFRAQALAICSNANARELEFRATSLSTLTQMVAGGAGVTLLPELAVPTETSRAALRVRPFGAPVPHRTIALVWRKRAPFADALRQVANTVRGAYPHPPASAAASKRPSKSAPARGRGKSAKRA